MDDDNSFGRDLDAYGIEYHKKTFPNGCLIVAGYNQLPVKKEVCEIVKRFLAERNNPTVLESCQNPDFFGARSGVIKGFIIFDTMKITGSGNMGLGELSESGVAYFEAICKENEIPFRHYPDKAIVDETELIGWLDEVLKS